MNLMNKSEIIEMIEKLGHKIEPISTSYHTSKRSDGLSQTTQQHKYGHQVQEIREAIWNGQFTRAEKMQLNEALVTKMKI